MVSLLQILLLAQHVSGTILPIIRSSRVLYRWLLPVVFGALFFQIVGLVWSCGLCVRFAGCCSIMQTGPLYPRRNPWYSHSEAESTLGHMVPSGGVTENIPSDTTGNRSWDRPTSSAVP